MCYKFEGVVHNTRIEHTMKTHACFPVLLFCSRNGSMKLNDRIVSNKFEG